MLKKYFVLGSAIFTLLVHLRNKSFDQKNEEAFPVSPVIHQQRKPSSNLELKSATRMPIQSAGSESISHQTMPSPSEEPVLPRLYQNKLLILQNLKNNSNSSNYVAEGFQSVVLPEAESAKILENFKKKHPEADLGEDGKVTLIGSTQTDEIEVSFPHLHTDCPVLNEVTSPLLFRVSTGGTIIKIVPLVVGEQIPSALYACRFSGGPQSIYRTLFTPTSMGVRR